MRRWHGRLRGSAAVLLTLAAPAVSTWGALTTGHTGLTHRGIVLIAASLIGAAVGMLVAARRGQPVRPGPWPGRYRLSPGRTRNDRRDRLMEKAILLAVAASLCTATSSVCQRKGARSSPPRAAA